MSHPTRSALIIPVPEAEPLVAPHRDRLDPVAALGVPAHITALYPFLPPSDLDKEAEIKLAELAGGVPAFRVDLIDVRRFPDVLWLAPSPPDPFITLTERASLMFGLAPYGGLHDTIIPHLTVGHGTETRAETLEATLRAGLPIAAWVHHIELWTGGRSGWQRRARFPLRREILQTERLILRTWDPKADADAIFEIWGDAETMKQVDGGVSQSPEQVRRSLCLGNRVQGQRGHCLWAMVLRDTGEVIGDCGFHTLDDRSGLELGYHLNAKFWGRGFATEAADACVKHAFDTLGVQIIHTWTTDENKASLRVLAKLGFEHIGIEEGEHHFVRSEAVLRSEAVPG